MPDAASCREAKRKGGSRVPAWHPERCWRVRIVQGITVELKAHPPEVPPNQLVAGDIISTTRAEPYCSFSSPRRSTTGSWLLPTFRGPSAVVVDLGCHRPEDALPQLLVAD